MGGQGPGAPWARFGVRLRGRRAQARGHKMPRTATATIPPPHLPPPAGLPHRRHFLPSWRCVTASARARCALHCHHRTPASAPYCAWRTRCATTCHLHALPALLLSLAHPASMRWRRRHGAYACRRARLQRRCALPTCRALKLNPNQ